MQTVEEASLSRVLSAHRLINNYVKGHLSDLDDVIVKIAVRRLLGKVAFTGSGESRG